MSSSNHDASTNGLRSEAHIATTQAQRLLNRLCNHWSHRFTVAREDQHGSIDFGTSKCDMTATASHLLVILTLSPGEDPAELEEVVAEHLRRVGNDASLIIDWQRGAPSPAG